MNDPVRAESIQGAQASTIKKVEKLEGEQALRLIESAARAPRVAADQLGRFPPPAPVSAAPREGSTVHVVA